eukprot:2049642-Pleurochrysis_carterae.AAC.4
MVVVEDAESLASPCQKCAHNNTQKHLEKVTREKDHFDEGPRWTPQSGLGGAKSRARLQDEGVRLLRESFAAAEAATLAEEEYWQARNASNKATFEVRHHTALVKHVEAAIREALRSDANVAYAV